MRPARLPLSAAILLACGCAAGGSSAPPRSQSPAAVLGIVTEAPSPELAEELGLPFKVRQQCRVVTSVTGPAASAGVRAGDVLFAIGDVDLYSQDDLDDVLRASRPGDRVSLGLRHEGADGAAEVARVFGVHAVPTLLALDGDGRILGRRTGFVEPAALVAWLETTRKGLQIRAATR